MNSKDYSRPLSLRKMQITDEFWKKEMELVRTEVIPYQWDALNDNVEGAAPSFCMRNFKIAGKLNRSKRELGSAFEEPKYTFRGFEAVVIDEEVCGESVKAISIAGFREENETAVKALSTALYGRYIPTKKEDVTLKFVPYYTWANRGENEMQVWVRV